MGQKSRTKKNRSPQSAAASKNIQQRQTVKANTGMQLASLSGGVAPTSSQASSPLQKGASAFASADNVRQDIQRISVLLGIVAVLLIIMTLINTKTPLLHRVGSQLSGFLHFN